MSLEIHLQKYSKDELIQMFIELFNEIQRLKQTPQQVFDGKVKTGGDLFGS